MLLLNVKIIYNSITKEHCGFNLRESETDFGAFNQRGLNKDIKMFNVNSTLKRNFKNLSILVKVYILQVLICCSM